MRRLDLAALPANPVTRFAPSPTGPLHLGHVANAVWTWGIARAGAGRVLLRIEDHDRGRCRPEYERQVVEDLAWLGLEPDPDPGGSGRRLTRQGDRADLYHAALGRLAERHPVYACQCSRRDIAMAHGQVRVPGSDELPYPGTCRMLGLARADGRGVRVAIAPGVVAFDDLRHGTVTQHPGAQCGDLLVRDRHGNWTYQFCVVVDDHDQGVNLVIRGDDLLESTGRQILLGKMLGRSVPPAFLHHPLILSHATAAKLSKRDGATGLAAMREAGFTREQVLGEAAFRTGLIAAPRDLGPGDLPDLFA